MAWIRRRVKGKKRPANPPAGPTPADIERAAQEAQRARATLHQVEAQTPEVETTAQHLERKLRENSIGPRFWAALGERRA